jgi:hypothetical protein
MREPLSWHFIYRDLLWTHSTSRYVQIAFSDFELINLSSSTWARRIFGSSVGRLGTFSIHRTDSSHDASLMTVMEQLHRVHLTMKEREAIGTLLESIQCYVVLLLFGCRRRQLSRRLLVSYSVVLLSMNTQRMRRCHTTDSRFCISRGIRVVDILTYLLCLVSKVTISSAAQCSPSPEFTLCGNTNAMYNISQLKVALS